MVPGPPRARPERGQKSLFGPAGLGFRAKKGDADQIHFRRSLLRYRTAALRKPCGWNDLRSPILRLFFAVAATHAVLEIAGRPAVLQEWLAGRPSNDWPVLAAVPGVWFRLVSQAALGLQTAHQAGLVHGNLHSGQVVFTAEGVVKLCGFGEPAWLAVPPSAETEASPEGDLLALGRCALAWATPPPDGKKGLKPKPLPDSLQTVLRRLCGEEGEPYADAGTLLEDLDAAGSAVPANAAAWERFVRQVREHSSDAPLRRSA